MILVFALIISMVAIRVMALSPVLVHCDNATLSSHESVCQKQGTSVTCDSVEDGLNEAERRNTTMLVENAGQCTQSLQRKKHSCLSSVEHRKDSIKKRRQNSQYGSKAFNTMFCPPGFIQSKVDSSDDNVTACKCLDGVKGMVKCADIRGSEVAFIRHGVCLTHDDSTNTTNIANCLYSCHVSRSLLDGRTDFDFLPDNFSNIEETMCDKLNRRGFLCSKCSPGYKPPAFSYSSLCMPCSPSRMELVVLWIKYFAIAFVPQSILFLLMVLFRVGITAPPFISIIHIFQAMGAPMYLQSITRLFTCWTNASVHKGNTLLGLKLLITFYGFFNLDFFRVLITPSCLKLDYFQLTLLEYASTFWLLFLMILAYLFIELHSRGFKLVVCILKPVTFCLNYCKQDWQTKHSLIKVFASFLLLSWIKLLSISFNLLTTVCVYTANNSGDVSVDCTHLYYSPEMKLFRGQHVLFGLSSIFVLIVFILLPLFLLILYPFRLFQRLLNWCGFHSQALHIFMDSFQGSLRDGTEGTTDCRWYSSFYLIGRIAFILLASLTSSRYFFPIASKVLMIAAVLVSLIRPFKKSRHNTFEVILQVILAIFFASNGAVTVAQFATLDNYVVPSIALAFIFSILPIVASISYGVWWIMEVKRARVYICSHIQKWWRRKRQSLEETLPHRMHNPREYEDIQMVSIQYHEYS